ncbi:hypothetical protein, partial [Billgrantia desiderata]|uniref:hypothetical protein n=1 Tax=Billgrantia desiderata TaxID=52021 RepID=UPI001C3D2621
VRIPTVRRFGTAQRSDSLAQAFVQRFPKPASRLHSLHCSAGRFLRPFLRPAVHAPAVTGCDNLMQVNVRQGFFSAPGF